MRKPTFSDEQIITAALDLQKQNKQITGYALANTLGGGNPSRLKSVWDNHLLNKQDQESEIIPDSLSPLVEEAFDNASTALLKHLKSLIIECKFKINQQSINRVEESKLKYAEQISQLENNLNDADSLIHKTQSKIEQLESERLTQEELHTKINELEKHIIALQTELSNQSDILFEKERLIEEQANRIQELAFTSPQYH